MNCKFKPVADGYTRPLATSKNLMKDTKTELAGIKNLYKIGFSSSSVDDRIKNAKNEATYLFSDVKKIATYKVYNRNADKLEN